MTDKTRCRAHGRTNDCNLLKLFKEIVNLCMKHNNEADSCNLLMEIENVEILVD
jgi:hypothetical protein